MTKTYRILRDEQGNKIDKKITDVPEKKYRIIRDEKGNRYDAEPKPPLPSFTNMAQAEVEKAKLTRKPEPTPQKGLLKNINESLNKLRGYKPGDEPIGTGMRVRKKDIPKIEESLINPQRGVDVFTRGAINVLGSRIPEKVSPVSEETKQRGAYIGGEVFGYVAPASGWSKAAGSIPVINKLAPKVGDTLLKSIFKKGLQVGTQEAVAGAGMGLAEGVGKGEDLKETLKRSGEYAVFGGIGGGIFGSGGEIIKNRKAILEGTKKFAKEVSESGLKDTLKTRKIDKGYQRIADEFIPKKVPEVPTKVPETPSFIREPAEQVGKAMPETIAPANVAREIPETPSFIQEAGTPTAESIEPMKVKAPIKFESIKTIDQLPKTREQRILNQEYKRVEESGVKTTLDKPQGLYVAPNQASLLTEGLEEAGGSVSYYKKNPNANDLILDTDMFTTNRGLTGESAGIGALRKFVGDDEVVRLAKTNKNELANILKEKYPDIEWNKYYDQQEMLEGYAGILAREKGYDGILALDKYDSTGQFDEYVALTDNAFIPTDKNIIDYNSIKTIDQLPTTREGLEQYINQANEAKSKGFKIDLQLFGEAEKKLKEFKTKLPPMSSVEDRIVSGTEDLKLPFKENVKKKWNNFYMNWVDPNKPIETFSKLAEDNSFIKATNVKKVGATVDYIANKKLVNMKGKEIGESIKDIAQSIPAKKEKEFWSYMLHRHNLARQAEGVPVLPDWTIEQSENAIKKYKADNPEFTELSKRIDKFMRSFADEWLGESGLVDKDLLEELYDKYPNYIPTQRQFSQLEKGMYGYGKGSGYVDTGSVLQKAKGSDRNIRNPMENILNLVDRTVRQAKRNDVGKSILKSLKEQPGKLGKYADILPENYAGNKTLDNIVYVVEDGQKQYLRINDQDFLDAIKQISKTDIQGFGRTKFINNLFKSLITQKNPIFAVRNIARDIPTSYIYGAERNPIKFFKDLGGAIKDVVKDDDVYKRYKAIGGASANFFSPANATKYKDLLMGKTTIKDRLLMPAKKLMNNIEAFNNLTETAPRLAEFKRVLAKTGDIEQALYKAGEISVNFSRGGKSAKTLDIFVPYTNAAVQGLDKFFREAISNPKKIIAKGLLAITIPTIAQEFINQSVDPEAYDKLDNRTKDNYFVIAAGDGEFIKIPKSRELGVLFSALFQRVYRKVMDEPESFKGFGTTVATGFSPSNPLQSNLLAPYMNLRANKDFADRAIVPLYMELDKRPAYLQFDEKTSEIAIAIGESFNLSPKEIDYIIKSYTGVIGQFLLPATTKGGSPSTTLKTQFTSDVAYSNQATRDFYDNLNKLQSQSKELKLNKQADVPKNIEFIKKKFESINKGISEFNKLIEKEKDLNKKRELRLKTADFMDKANTYLNENSLSKFEILRANMVKEYDKIKK